MLLDYGPGTLTIYKNGRRLGIVQERLAGGYSGWYHSVATPASVSKEVNCILPRQIKYVS